MVGQVNRAEARVYQSDSNPFIKMMLTMMDAMGMIDRLPNNGLYGQYGSPWSSYSNPYTRALALRGIYPGTSSSFYNNPYSRNLYGNNLYSGYGTNPFVTSPWLSSPWLGGGQYGLPYASPLWGSPDWGVLPAEKHVPFGDPYYGHSYWSDADLEGWVDEPWEVSEWNPEAEESDVPNYPQARQRAQSQQQAARPQQAQQPNVPLVQNFNITVPESGQPGHGQGSRPDNVRPGSVNNRSPLAKMTQPGPPRSSRARPDGQPPLSPLHKRAMQQGPAQSQLSQQQWSQQQMMQQPDMQRPDRKQTRRKPREKPCITEFCGLKKPNLNGLWVAQNGEMLGVKGDKFLWADTTERYLAGYLKVENEYLVASVEGSERLLRFKYKLAGDHLLTMQPDGVIREFIRTTPGEIYGGYFGGY